MLKNYLFKKMIKSKLIIVALLVSNGSALTATDITPYPDYQTPTTFWQGAEYELKTGKDFDARIKHDLQDMKYNYNINCLNIYGMENITTTQLDNLFCELKTLGMQTVVRIEWYEASWMNFETADADQVINHYNSLIQYVCDASRRDQVAYFALNVPVDDPDVAAHFVTNGYPDGRSNPFWASNQITYVNYFVSQMRNICNSYGFTDAKQYVSVFYGWDYSYPTPSYANSNADGYFFNNYSYPQNSSFPPDETQPDSILINKTRLQIGMNKFMAQYPNAEQGKVIEYGFHTSEFNGGVIPNQTAGLVKTLAAKQRALKATTIYYNSSGFQGMKGTQYFGWNLLKDEGTPPALMDWCLDYPKNGKIEAESATLYGHVRVYTDADASNGEGVTDLNYTGDALAIFNITQSPSFQIRYACDGNSQLSLYLNGQYIQKINFPTTGAFTGMYDTVTIDMSIPSGATIRLQRDTGDNTVNIDYIQLLLHSSKTKVEAENCSLSGNAYVFTDGAASNGKGVAGLDNIGDAAAITNVNLKASTSFNITYACEGNNQLSLYINGVYTQKISFPSTGGWTGAYSTITVNANIPAGAIIKIQHDAGDIAANLDCFELLVAPQTGKVEAERCLLSGNARVYTDAAASNGKGVAGLDNNGDAVTIANVAESNSFGLTYACNGNSQLSLYINGVYMQEISFPSTGKWTGTYSSITVNTKIPAGATIKIQHGDYDIAANLDYFTFNTTNSTGISSSNIIDKANTKIYAFPNPFNSELHINLSKFSEFKELRVIDETGRIIENKNINKIQNLSIGNKYRPGMYMLQFVSWKDVKSIVVIKE